MKFSSVSFCYLWFIWLLNYCPKGYIMTKCLLIYYRWYNLGKIVSLFCFLALILIYSYVVWSTFLVAVFTFIIYMWSYLYTMWCKMIMMLFVLNVLYEAIRWSRLKSILKWFIWLWKACKLCDKINVGLSMYTSWT